MGYSTKAINFFVDSIELDVHTASYPEHIGHIPLWYFSDGMTLKLEEVLETGEYIVTREDGAFIHGPEI